MQVVHGVHRNSELPSLSTPADTVLCYLFTILKSVRILAGLNSNFFPEIKKSLFLSKHTAVFRM